MLLAGAKADVAAGAAEPLRRPWFRPTGVSDYPLGYRPAFDGLRAVAVLPVVFSHYRVPGFTGAGAGYGVDIFFVLSGFLITSLLLNTVERGQPLAVFWWRRFLRLTPALVFLCVTLLAAGPILGIFAQAKIDVVASLLYVSNWTRAFPTGAPMYLGNTWSLSIEEQFYLVWPLVLTVALRARGRAGALVVAVALVVVSVLWLAWMVPRSPLDRVYNGFDTRCSGLLLGGIVALAGAALPRFGRLLGPAAMLAAVACLAIMVTRRWDAWTSVGLCLAVAIVIADTARRDDGIIQKLLALPVLVAVGRISYALYLWHYPLMLIVFQVFGLSWGIGAALGIGLSFAFSAVSYIIEQRALRYRSAFTPATRARLGRAAASVSLAGMLAGVWVFWSADLINLLDPKPLTIVAYGPKTIRKGQAFNVQPDGRSALWLQTSHSFPQDSRFKIGDHVLETFVRTQGGAATVPLEVRDKVGATSLVIVRPDGTVIAGPVPFVVVE